MHCAFDCLLLAALALIINQEVQLMKSGDSRSASIKIGFTLVELTVVVAIIGLLATMVLSSLNDTRKKSRDARRIADLKELRAALELYITSQPVPTYPPGPYAGASGLASKLVPNQITSLPTDPLNSASFVYRYCLISPTSYVLEALLETSDHPANRSDSDTAQSPCPDSTGNSITATGNYYDLAN